MKKVLTFIRSSQTFKNSSWSAFEVLVLPILMLVATPYFLVKLGEEQYGQWMLVNSIIASFGVLNLGLGEATIRYIAKYKAEDLTRTVKIANTTYSFYLLISILGFLLGYAYLVLEENTPLFLSSRKNEFISILQLGLVLFGVRLIEQIVFSIYKGFERFDLFSKFSIMSKTMLIIVNIIVVYLGYSLNTIILSSVLSSLIVLVVEFFFLKRFLPGFSVFPMFDKEIFLEIMSFGLWSWVQSIIGILGYQMDKFMVARLAGVRVLAYYSIGFTITTQIFNVFTAASNWIFPKVSRNDLSQQGLNTLYHKSQGLLVAFASFTIVIFYQIKDPFLKLWLGEDVFLKALPYINAYCVFLLFVCLTIIPSFFTLGTSNMKLMTGNSVFSVALTVGSMFFMFNIYGPVGLAFGRILSSAISIPIFLLLFYKLVLKSSYRSIVHELSIPFVLSVLLLSGNSIAVAVAVVFVSALFIYHLKTFLNFYKIKL